MSENYDFAQAAAEALENAVRAFTEWTSQNWTMSEAEANDLTDPCDSPKSYARGYNDAMASVPDAFSIWMEEFHG